ncbi:unnamed protein product, partial [marine sediment metagenome]
MNVKKVSKNAEVLSNLEDIFVNSLEIFQEGKNHQKKEDIKEALKKYEDSVFLLNKVKENISKYKNDKTVDINWLNNVEEKNNGAIITVLKYISGIKDNISKLDNNSVIINYKNDDIIEEKKEKNIDFEDLKDKILDEVVNISKENDNSDDDINNFGNLEDNNSKEVIYNNENIQIKIEDNDSKNLFFLINKKYKTFIEKNFIKPLNYPELYKKNFNCLLLYGNKGNGKTFIAYNIIREINNKNIIKKIVDMRKLGEDSNNLKLNCIIILNKINKVIRNNRNSKIILLIEEIDLISEKNESKLFYEEFYKISKNDNVYIIATSNKPWEIEKKFLKNFQEKLLIEKPSIEDIGRYFYYKIIEYISIHNFTKEYYNNNKFIEDYKNFNIS